MWFRFNAVLLVGLLFAMCMIADSSAFSPVLFRGVSHIPSIHAKSFTFYKRPPFHRRSLQSFAKAVRKFREYNDNSKGIELTATNAMIFTNIALFTAAAFMPKLQSSLMKIDHRIARGETYRLLTALFAHSGMSHLVMNCFSLSNIGPQTERLFGPKKFFSIYLGAGILANTATFLAGSAPYSLGASGSTFGLLGALGTYYYVNRGVLGGRSRYALQSIKRTLVMNLLYSMSTPSVDHYAHAAGLGAGAALAFFLAPRLGNRRHKSLLCGYRDSPYWAYWKSIQQRLTGTHDSSRRPGTSGSIDGIHSNVSEEYAQYLRDFQRQHAHNQIPSFNKKSDEYIEYGDLSEE